MSIDRIPTWGLWGTVRDAFTDLEDEIENIEVGEAGPASDVGIRYVTEDGSDLADGLTWETANASPQAAYDDLCDYADANLEGINGRIHVGAVYIARATGLYDVGDNLALRKTHSAEFRGFGMTRAQNRFEGMPQLTVSAAGATEVVALTDEIVNTNGYGFRFIDLGFVVDVVATPNVTAVIRGDDINFTDIEGCRAEASNGNMPGYFIEADAIDDCSWFNVQGCRVHSMGLIKCVGTAHNANRWYIARNQVFGTRTGSGMTDIEGIVDLFRCYDGTFINNNLETGNVAFQVGSGNNNTFINNAGEASSYDEPFYQFTGTTSNLVIGGRCTVGAAASQNGLFVLVDGTSRDILLVHAGIKAPGDAATAIKDRVSDLTDVKGQLTVLSSRGFQYSGHAIQAPWLGNNPPAAAHNTNGNIWYNETDHKMMARINGVNREVALV